MPDTPDPPKQRTITMSGRLPVRIKEQDWPIVASAQLSDARPGHNWTRKVEMYVRQHADGRRLVYGTCRSTIDGEPHKRGGELLDPGDDLVHMANEMAKALGYKAPDYTPEDLANALLADMPAEPLD